MLLKGANLSGVDLSACDLSGYDLSLWRELKLAGKCSTEWKTG
jgi:uncharacterized protein YjbI with pentapeptide repeats